MEYLDVVDETGEPVGERVERAEAHARGILHRTSHVWVLRRRGGEVEVLLQLRAAAKASYPERYDVSSANGYAIDDEENEMGVRCVAVAIPGPDGRAESAFSISGLAPYMTPERIRRVAALALDTRTDILADLGVGRKG